MSSEEEASAGSVVCAMPQGRLVSKQATFPHRKYRGESTVGPTIWVAQSKLVSSCFQISRSQKISCVSCRRRSTLVRLHLLAHRGARAAPSWDTADRQGTARADGAPSSRVILLCLAAAAAGDVAPLSCPDPMKLRAKPGRAPSPHADMRHSRIWVEREYG
jgi:hypothetical protein